MSSEGTCAAHARRAASTCLRCGLFMCDWCLKLAPSWGPGLCPACQRVVAPTAPTALRPRGARFWLAVLGAGFGFSVLTGAAERWLRGGSVSARETLVSFVFAAGALVAAGLALVIGRRRGP